VGFGGWFSPVALHVDRASVDSPGGVVYTGVTGVDQPLLADPAAWLGTRPSTNALVSA